MKTSYLFFTITIITLFFTFALQAQVITHRTSTNLDTYEGTWEYATKTDTFQIILKKGVLDMDDVVIDCLYGVHYYKKNGEVIADYRNLLPNLSRKNQTIYATNAVSPQFKDYFKPNQLSFDFKDDKHNRIPSGWLTRDPNKPNELLWHFNKDEWWERWISEDTPEEDRPKPGYSVPDEVIMKKIK